MKKRILSILLAAVMLVCLLPMTALAEEEAAFDLHLRDPETGNYPGEAYVANDYGYSVPWYTLGVESATTTWTYLGEDEVERTTTYPQTMRAETVYTVHIELTLKTGYTFSDPPKITLMGAEPEFEVWSPSKPRHVIIRHTYPATAPRTPIEKVAVTATEPLCGASVDSTVECEYHVPYTVQLGEWSCSTSTLLTSSDVFKAGETYTLTVFLQAKGDAKFTADLAEANCNLNPDWKGDGIHPTKIRILGDDAAELYFSWTIPDPVGSLALFAVPQAYGEHPNNYSWTEEGADYYISQTKWFDEHDLRFLDSGDVLTEGHDYHVEMDVYPAKGHTLSEGVTAALNGVPSTHIDDHYSFITVYADAPVKEAELIHTVKLTYSDPVDVGVPAIDWAEVPPDAHYEVVSAVWYDEAGSDIYGFDFEDDKRYTFKITLVPESGYAFADDARFLFNGEALTATAEGRERTVEKTYDISSWNPSVTAEGVFDLAAGAGIGDFKAEKDTLTALGEAGLISVRGEMPFNFYYDLDKDGTEDILIGPTKGGPKENCITLLPDRSLEGEWSMSLNEAALDYLKTVRVPAYYESMKFIFPDLVWIISFEADGGSGEMPADELKRGEKYILPECAFTPPEDQVFDSWSLGLPGEEVDIADNWTIQAKWRDRYWIVSFWASEGSGEMASVKVEKGEKYTLPDCSFTPPEGQEFERWDLGEAGKEIEIDTDTLITALWKDKVYWTISFDANGGSGEMEPIKVEDGTSYALPECLFEAPEGKEFEKWDQGAAGEEIMIDGDTAITALWKDKPIEYWTVSFFGEGGTGEMADIQVEKGKVFTLPDCTFAPPEGKVFDAWDLGSPGSDIELTGDTTARAKWKDKPAEYWIISFYDGGGSGEMAQIQVEKGEKLTLPDCGFTAPEGREFDKWDLGAAGEELMIDGDTAITALWKDKPIEYWTVSFFGEGGTGEMADIQVEKGKVFTLPDCTFAPPEGKEFDTWDLGSPGSDIELTGDTTARAKWKDKPAEYWIISFYDGGGSGDMAQIQVEKGEKLTLPDCTFIPPEGREFDAWDLGAPGEEIGIDGDTSVTARWKEKEVILRNPFEDVAESAYFYDAVLWAFYAEPQVTNGMDATHFGPASTVTRGQAVTFLWRAMGCPEPETGENPFEDVTESKYYYKAVLWAVEKGITNGTDATHFTPNQTCSTAHIITFLYRTMGIGTNGWYAAAEAWARESGLLDGLEITVAPKVDCPRCDVVLFLFRQLAE